MNPPLTAEQARALGVVLPPEFDVRTYPPPGYLHWTLFDVGNGDTYGYYWPVGREAGPPLVCTTLHDSGALLPVASSAEGCLRLEWATRYDEEDEEELRATARAFGVALAGAPVRLLESGGIDYWDVASAADLLPLDPGSPHLLLLDARARNAAGDVAGAEAALRVALDPLPEYGEALYQIAQVLRRQGRRDEANAALLDVLTAPVAFTTAETRTRALGAIRRAPDAALPPDRAGDPLWAARARLTLATGVKTNDDYLLYEEGIAAYHDRGDGARAVGLRVLVGELMHRETVSFQERYGWTEAGWRAQLSADLARAGLTERRRALFPSEPAEK